MGSIRRWLSISLAAAAVAAGLVAPGFAAEAQSGSTFASSPGEGPTGTNIEVSGARCLLPGSTTPGDGVVVRLVGGGEVVADDTLPVEPDGTWSGVLPVPAGTAARDYRLEAKCISPGFEDVDPVTYTRRSFTVTGEGDNAQPEAPTTPNFNGGIEPFPEYDGQSTCSPSTKPGMQRFMDMVRANYGGGSLGVGRACNVGGTSEHKEGRAWDWAMNAGSSSDRARVDSLFRWLFETDNNCNRYARARRLGIMYIIWNRRMFRMYDTARGWAAYSGPSPHTDHVHFSLTRAGGAGTTSFWNPTYHANPNWDPSQRTVQQLTVNQPGGQPQIADFNGDGYEDILWYRPGTERDFVWYANGQGAFRGNEVTVTREYQPLAGDFNGDCVGDVFWYGSGEAKDYLWYGNRNSTFRGVDVNVTGTFRPFVEDFNGDRAQDIFWYQPGPGNDVIWDGSIYGFLGRQVTVNGDYQPLAGDFNGNGPADVLWYGAGGARDVLWFGGRSGGFTGQTVTVNGTYEPFVGDFNGDQREDLFWYGRGAGADTMWLGASNRTFLGRSLDMPRDYDFHVTGDFQGNNRDDILWHGSPTAEPTRVWNY